MHWVKKGLIFKPSDLPEFRFTHAQCPTAMDLGDRIRVFFGSRLEDGSGGVFYLDLDSNDPNNILYIHKMPVLVKGGIGSFDQDGVLQVCLQKSGKNISMYYGGFSKMISSPHTCMMGLAVSKDEGQSFSRISEGPIFAISKIDPFLIGSADVVIKDNIHHMIYTSGTQWVNIDNQFELSYTLKYGSSFDGINWKPSGEIVIPHSPGVTAECKPSIFKVGDTFHMYFSTRKIFDYRDYGSGAYRLTHAVSNDLISWRLSNAEYGEVEVSQDGWDSGMICYPNIIEINGKFLMFYNGNDFGKSGFGYAELEF